MTDRITLDTLRKRLTAAEPTESGRFEVVDNGFGGTTTRRVAGTRPNFRRGTQVETSSEATVIRPATEKQVAFLRKLVAERQPDADEAFIQSVIDRGAARVSTAIDRLKAMPKVEAAPAERTNRFAGTCEDCGTRVDPEEGILTRTDAGTWEVAHRPGDCPVSEFPFPLGSYAVDNADGEVRFFHATTDGLFVLASDNLHPVASGAAGAIIAQIAEDPEAASRRFGIEWKTCGRCGRGLTDTTPGGSRDQGIGPVCAAKGW